MTKEQKNFFCYSFICLLQVVAVWRLVSEISFTETDPALATARVTKFELGTRERAVELLLGQVQEPLIQEATELGNWEGDLQWPVKDAGVVRGYGSGQGGYHRAIDMTTPLGPDKLAKPDPKHVRVYTSDQLERTQVFASADGIVAYQGDQLEYYGNIIFIVHAHGFITMYAHLNDFVVQTGQFVKRGQLIAHLGTTGGSDGPHVHWEFKQGGLNCDPMPLVHQDIARASKKEDKDLIAHPQLNWERPESHPPEIQCAEWREHPRMLRSLGRFFKGFMPSWAQ